MKAARARRAIWAARRGNGEAKPEAMVTGEEATTGMLGVGGQRSR